jgi:hypothetical protein
VYLKAPDLLAGKIPLSPERLQSESQLIVVGKVESLSHEEQSYDDGSKKAHVTLSVNVEEVTKGDWAIGKPIKVRCWQIVKNPRGGLPWDNGNRFIPATGGRARFYLKSESHGVWDSQWPNGVEGLDGATPFRLPLQPSDSVLWSPYVIAAIGGTVLAVLLIVYCGLRGGKSLRSQPH